MWHHQVEGLADAFRVVALDLPGHGALVDVPFRLADASAAAALAIEGLPGGRAVVVGQSLGGYVGTDLAARRPDLVAGLVLVNSSAEPRSVARRAPATVGAYLARATAESLRARGRRTGRAADAGDGPEAGAIVGRDGLDGPDGAEPELPATKGWLFRGSGRALVAALRESFVPRLAAYPGPTLILNGADDALFRSGERTFLAVAADGRLEVIPGTGHLVCEEQPAAFNAALRRFAAEAHERPRA